MTHDIVGITFPTMNSIGCAYKDEKVIVLYILEITHYSREIPVMNFMDSLIKKWEMKHSMAPIKDEIFKEH
jgi:hypothetical protein